MERMTAEAHRSIRELLAAHAAERLSEAQRSAVEAHLAGCPDCRREVEELGRLLAAVQTLDVASIDEAPAPSADLEDRVVSRVREGSTRPRVHADDGGVPQLATLRVGGRRIADLFARRPVRGALAAAAAIALLAAGIGIGSRLAQPTGPPFERIAFEEAPPGVQADGKLIAHTWGTEVNLVISGMEPGRIYRATFVAADGTESDGGTFIGVSGRPILCNLNAAVLRPDVVELRISDDSGVPVLRADLADPS